jgi:hypothetical protein
MAAKFKNEQNQYYYRGLFFETTLADKSTVVYTLKNEDHEGYPSLYRLYMETDDPTEYQFAIQHLGGWEHWQKLCKCSWFKEYIQSWRAELEVRTRSKALLALRDIAKDSTHKASAAVNRYLVDNGWKAVEEKKGRGRPSKDEVKKEADRIARESRDTEDEFQRISGSMN